MIRFIKKGDLLRCSTIPVIAAVFLLIKIASDKYNGVIINVMECVGFMATFIIAAFIVYGVIIGLRIRDNIKDVLDHRLNTTNRKNEDFPQNGTNSVE